ncbi:hypothetical protein DH09_06335 [Bacillaceae bacterium JMAK1]|nr:hypothetical protein DH09_06335 [Bacillaceae bacterium JMAK1]
MHSEKIAIPLSEELFSEIKHLTEKEQDQLFFKMVQQYVERKKKEQLIQDLKQGYEEMAAINRGLSETFAFCEWEAQERIKTIRKVSHY